MTVEAEKVETVKVEVSIPETLEAAPAANSEPAESLAKPYTQGAVASIPGTPEPEAELVAASGLEEALEQHRAWVISGGHAGRQANLSRAQLQNAELTDANLRDASLNKTVLRGADLLLADLQGASLLQADLRDTNLLGTRFRDANLQGATLAGATGLQSEQLAGANLFGAALPAHTPVAAALAHVLALARTTGWLIVAMLLVNGLVWLRIATTGDAQLLQNAPVLPFATFQTSLPLVPFYLLCPVFILGLYLCFHLYLQRLWDGTAALPAILPDGRRLDACIPWYARWPARTHLKWLKEHNPSLSRVEAGISMALLYGVAPATVILFWGRYLTLQDLRGTMLHVSLAVVAAAAAVYFARAAGRAFKVPSPTSQNAPTSKLVWAWTAVAPGIGVVLFLLSIGTIWGIPHDDRSAQEPGTLSMRTWAGDILWLIGYSPTAQLAESDVSFKPADWNGRGQDLTRIEGARLNGLRLHYVQAYGAFFAKAHLWQADLSNAYLSEADLREANLRQAILRSTVLDRARLNRAVLQDADLQGANLTQADLQEANLSHASLVGALLPDAKLDGANLYAADLRNAVMQRASLQHADLREARLEGATLTMGILRQAYLSSAKMAGARLQQAQLAQAFLTQADLRKADLRGANLQGAILSGADLTGANLQEADLRGVLELSAAQICSAANLRQIQLDENLQHDVENRCGLNH